MKIVVKLELSDIVNPRKTNSIFRSVCEEDYLLNKIKKTPCTDYVKLYRAAETPEDESFLTRRATQKNMLGKLLVLTSSSENK